jgi:Protein of unknown function (DUF2863)
MKRTRSKTQAKLPREAEKLVFFATSMANAGSRMEVDYWEVLLFRQSRALMEAGNIGVITRALDFAFEANPRAYDVLNAIVESNAESITFVHDGKAWSALLISLPVVAWSRYGLPSGNLGSGAKESLAALKTHLQAHVLSAEAKVAMSPNLFSVDQAPRDYKLLNDLMYTLAKEAIGVVDNVVSPLVRGKLPETIPLPADSRFLLATVVAPATSPLFRWQESAAPMTREICFKRWNEAARPHFTKLIPGSEFECLLPDAFFVNIRRAEGQVRPMAVRGGVAHMEATWKTDASKLTAIVAGVGEARVDEYRIGFSLKGETDVIDGAIWPLIDEEQEDDTPSPRDQIVAVLRECKVGEIITPDSLFRPEACEDCGAPFFVNSDSDMVHVELPDDDPAAKAHYH